MKTRIRDFYYSQSFLSLMVMLAVFLGVVNIFHREYSMTIIKKRFDDMPCSAECLNKRAINQIILLNANLENRALTPEEIDIIKQNWHGAEYDKIDKDLKVKE